MELLGAFLPFIIMMAIMYFLLIRPQKKQQEKKQSMLDSLKPGNHVITIGGLYGIIDEVDNVRDTVVLDCEGVYLTFTRPAIARVLDESVINHTIVNESDNLVEDTDTEDITE